MLKIRKNHVRAAVRTIAVVSVVVGVAGFIGAHIKDSAPASALNMRFSKVGTHPRSSALVDTEYWYGPQLQDLAVSGGKLYAGYGDWDSNSDSWGPSTGRTALVPFDLASHTFESQNEIMTGSEAITNIREINGSLYVPTTDPSIHGTGGYLTNEGGTWQRVDAVPDAVHVFDVATLDGNDLWLFGSRDNYPPGDGSVARAMTWHSTDGGQTWNEAISDGSEPGQGYGYERYYWGQRAGSKLFMHASSTMPQTPMRSFDGTNNVTYDNSVTCSSRGHLVVQFLGKVVCSEGWIGDSYAGIVSIDENGVGTDVNYPSGGYINDFYVDGSYLYTLDNSGLIQRTDDLQNWTSFGMWEAPNDGNYTTATSLAVSGDKIYIGDSRANIYESGTTITAELAKSGPETCFELDQNGVITNYYDRENDNPANPACTRNVVIPSEIGGQQVTAIGSYSFQEKGILSLSLPSGITSIGSYAFATNELGSVTIPNGVDSISYGAFADNRLTTVTLPNNLTTLRSSAFRDNLLTSVTIPSSLTTLDENIFANNLLTSLTIPSSVTDIAYAAFENNQIETLTIPNSVTFIDVSAFAHNHLRSLTLPNGLEEIPDYAFSQNKLKEVTIPDSVTFISPTAFTEQSDMEPFTLPEPIVDDLGMSSTQAAVPTTLQEYLSSIWYVRLYTQNPANPNNLTSEAWVEHIDETACQEVTYDAAVESAGEMNTYACGGTNYQAACADVDVKDAGTVGATADCGNDLTGDGDSDDILDANFGGHLINPAYVTVRSETESGKELEASKMLTGKNGQSYVQGYMVKDGPVLQPSEEDDGDVIPFGVGASAAGDPNTVTLSGSYYHVGQTIQIPASVLRGYTLADDGDTLVSITLTAAVNEYTFVYEVAGPDAPGAPNSGAGTALMIGVVLVALNLLGLTAFLARRSIVRRHA